MRYLLTIFFCAATAALQAMVPLTEPADTVALLTRSDTIAAAYTDTLAQLTARYADRKVRKGKPSPYLFRLFAPGTVYASALAQDMGYGIPKLSLSPTSSPLTAPYGSMLAAPRGAALPQLGSTEDQVLLLNEAINNHLSKAYLLYPTLFATTQEELMSTPKLRSDLSQTVEERTTIAEEIIPLELPDIEPEAVMPEVKRPSFWKVQGNGSLQFTQTHFTDNWYQGGEDNYTMLSQLTLEANFDNKKLLQWNNKLEAQLGFQTSENTKPKFRATSNVVRFTSNLGVRAAANWNYAAQIQLESQPYMNYDNKGEKVTADFLSPLFIRSSIGMDYKLKTKRFEGKCHLAPLSYVITYVDRVALIGRHGIREGHNAKHEWGPNIDVNFTYKMWDNISWTSRIYWFSNLEQTRIEFENTIDFKISRFLSTKLFLYPRFDDSSLKYKAGQDHDGSYWMFKEWLSLGLNYDF